MNASKSIESPTRAPGQRFSYRILNIPELAATVAVVVFFFLFSTLDASMATPDNLVRILTTASYTGIAAIGMIFLMMAGEIDLSNGATAGLCASVAGTLIAYAGAPEWLGLLGGVVTAILFGLTNSFFTLVVGMPSFFATLGASFIVGGLIGPLMKGQWIMMSGQLPFLDSLGAASPLFGLPWTVILFLVLVIIGDFLLRRTKVGAVLAATGGNKRAAQATGINTNLVKTLCFVFVSVCSAFAGFFVMSASQTADGSIGAEWGLWVIFIAIIGGGSLLGGVGSVLGGLLGAILMQVIKSGLSAAHIPTNVQGIVVGVILIAASMLDIVRRRAKKY